VVNVCVDTDAGCTFKISTLYSGGVVVVVTLCCCLLLWLLGTDAVNACYGSNGVCVCVCVCVFVCICTDCSTTVDWWRRYNTSTSNGMCVCVGSLMLCKNSSLDRRALHRSHAKWCVYVVAF
jgi:hypothetical protein